MPVAELRKRLPAADRAEQILDAAADLFITRGFEAVTMGDIAAALGVSRPTVYTYFPSTESLLDVMLDTRLDALLTRLEPILAAKTSADDMPNLTEPVFNLLLAERSTLALLYSGGGPTFRVRQHDFLAQVARRLPLTKTFPARDQPTLLLIITTLLGSLASRAATDPDVDAADIARTLAAFVRGGVRELTP
ncbi:TetR/AcrR family transcriptional regulator [Deinococcus rufus]|uniref:TetR/AcrR family transcriptional regulator n=1 Tax=Deinococcus rufus TaxID=2136097 RepID=A0ABV7ZAM2_9DEIO